VSKPNDREVMARLVKRWREIAALTRDTAPATSDAILTCAAQVESAFAAVDKEHADED